MVSLSDQEIKISLEKGTVILNFAAAPYCNNEAHILEFPTHILYEALNTYLASLPEGLRAKSS